MWGKGEKRKEKNASERGHDASACTCSLSSALISKTGMQKNYDSDFEFYLKRDTIYIAATQLLLQRQ